MSAQQCIGYGEFERRCQNRAGTPYTAIWCRRCDGARLAAITRQLEAVQRAAQIEDGMELMELMEPRP